MTGRALVVASDDRTVPKRFVGQLAPAYYCRGWNSKRLHYCRRRAGHGTTHLGVGRCKFHGGTVEGDGRVRDGRYSRIQSPRLAELIEHYKQDDQPFNVTDDLLLARAILHDFVERSAAGKTQNQAPAKAVTDALDEFEATNADHATPAQLALLERARAALVELQAIQALPDVAEAIRYIDVLSKMQHRYEMLRVSSAVSLEQVRRFLAAVDRVLQLRINDELLVKQIRRDIYDIRI